MKWLNRCRMKLVIVGIVFFSAFALSKPMSGQTGKNDTNSTGSQWHRIALVWDGSYRTLYVDGLAVAEDTQDGLQGSDSGLYIGCGKGMEAGTYWSGLIDDVRIYNRAVRP